MIPKNTSSSNFTDTFSSLFSALGLCSLLKVASFRKRAGYGASVSEPVIVKVVCDTTVKFLIKFTPQFFSF